MGEGRSELTTPMLLSYTPQILAMAALAAVSALFSCSEAALFFLSREQREKMASGGPGEKLAVRLLDQPEQLLSAILLCNLITNILYYSLAAGVTIGLQQQKAATLATGFSVGALLVLMIFSEMLPKNLGVTWPRQIAGLVSVPIALATRAIGPLMPALRGAMEITRRSRIWNWRTSTKRWRLARPMRNLSVMNGWSYSKSSLWRAPRWKK